MLPLARTTLRPVPPGTGPGPGTRSPTRHPPASIKSVQKQDLSSAFFLLPEDLPYLPLQIRQFIRGVVPENCMLDSEIAMGDYVTKTRNLLPVRFRVTFLEIVREILDRLSDTWKFRITASLRL